MQKYQRTYFKTMFPNYSPDSWIDLINDNEIISEVSGLIANEIHHIHDSNCYIKRQDYPIERLIALAQWEHKEYGDKDQYKDWLFWCHHLTMCSKLIPFKLENYPNDILIEDEHDAFTYYEWIKKNELVSEIHNGDLVNLIVRQIDGQVIYSVFAETKQQCIQEILFEL